MIWIARLAGVCPPVEWEESLPAPAVASAEPEEAETEAQVPFNLMKASSQPVASEVTKSYCAGSVSVHYLCVLYLIPGQCFAHLEELVH